MSSSQQPILSSLPLQILLYFHRIYLPLYFITTLALLIWKGVYLPYPNPSYGMEIAALCLFVVLEWGRLSIGSRGNLTELAAPMGIFAGLTIVSLFGYLFYAIWETYVVLVDLPLNIIGLAFVAGEGLIGTYQVFKLTRWRFH